MRKVVLFMHVSLDGFVGGPNGELEWINVDNEIFEFVNERTSQSDAAMYGRVTWQMMDGYWPTAADQPNASKHDIDHGKWYNTIDKYVVSNTVKSDPKKKVKVFGKDLVKDITELKRTGDKEILIFGSPGAGRSLSKLGLIDGYWLFVNPIIVGKGIPMFGDENSMTKLKLMQSHVFTSGVVCLYYELAK